MNEAAAALDRPGAAGPRPWGRAALWLLVIAPFFFLTYDGANWLAARRSDVGAIVFDWERHIPFLAWTIFPYWSIDALYGLSLFVCATRAELDTHVRRLLTAQIVAVACFVLFPLRFSFVRPEADGLAGALFGLLGSFDQPFNQAPSLHIALLVILWDLYARHVPRWLSLPLHVWFALIGASVLTTYQHHFVDVPTGALLGFICLWLWPRDAATPFSRATFAVDGKRRRLAAIYTAGSITVTLVAWGAGGAALWLLWPAVSLALVAANYAFFGAAGFQKRADGQMSPAARWLLAPYLLGAWINSRLWTRNAADAVVIRDGVWLGRIPARHETAGFTTIFDLCAELPGDDRHTGYRAVPMLDLVSPEAKLLRHVAGGIESARATGRVLVCCALGYSRSAAGIATWLLATGRAATLAEAIEQIRHAAPRIVLGESTRQAIAAAAAGGHR